MRSGEVVGNKVPFCSINKPETPALWTSAVVRHTGQEGFLITAYPTDAIKEGEQIWVIWVK